MWFKEAFGDALSKGPVVVGGVEEGDASAEGMHDYSGASLVVERQVVGAREPQASEA